MNKYKSYDGSINMVLISVISMIVIVSCIKFNFKWKKGTAMHLLWNNTKTYYNKVVGT